MAEMTDGATRSTLKGADAPAHPGQSNEAVQSGSRVPASGPQRLVTEVDAVHVAVDLPDGSRRTILHELSLTLDEPVVAVVGANGSGKSTLLRLVAGLVAPTAGEIRFSPAVPRSGFIFANPQAQIIMPVVGEDIEFSLRETVKSRAERTRRMREILTQLELGHRAESSVYELSSGERQKVALAGVLATEPELVIADEPTTLLDLRNAAEFRRRLLELQVPLLLATHDLEFAAQADRVLVFDQGRLVDDDEPAAAIARYRRLALQEPEGR
ncbi:MULTISPECIES: energy-coupling factor ABC transporter ATP-binding protein [Actinomycetes]|uniref:ABC transporter ATP-binding protein n=2 Tax=Actinomycetes TaxID=1760 RepID=A0ABP6LPQ9_9MICC|nr:ABC transporter ATP-binding protein [Nesterenkonia sp. PF2B19]